MWGTGAVGPTRAPVRLLRARARVAGVPHTPWPAHCWYGAERGGGLWLWSQSVVGPETRSMPRGWS